MIIMYTSNAQASIKISWPFNTHYMRGLYKKKNAFIRNLLFKRYRKEFSLPLLSLSFVIIHNANNFYTKYVRY